MDSTSHVTVVERPDRGRFERIISDLNERIDLCDSEYRKLNGTNSSTIVVTARTDENDGNSAAAVAAGSLPLMEQGEIFHWSQETSRFKSEKDTSRIELRSVITKIDALEQELKAKKQEIAIIFPNLIYKDENRLATYLRSLENQYANMQTSNVREENALVNEINKVKRSQKQLVKWRKLVAEKEEMSKTLAELKSQKNTLFKSCKSAKYNEASCRAKERQCKSRAQTVVKELDDLFNEKRCIVLSYEQDRKMYAEYVKHQKEQQPQKHGQTGCRRTASGASELDEFRGLTPYGKQQVKRTASHRSARHTFSNEDNSSESDNDDYELFYTEKQICRNLISFLHSFLPENSTVATVAMPEDCPDNSKVDSITLVTEIDVATASNFEVISKKDDSDDEKPLPNQTSLKQLKKRHSRKEKRRLTHSIPLSPDIFADFERVGLNAPVNYNEIQLVIDKLNDKLTYYENQTLIPLNFSYSVDKFAYATSESEVTMGSSIFSALSISGAADESSLSVRSFSQNSALDSNNLSSNNNNNEYSPLHNGNGKSRGRSLRLSSGIESDRLNVSLEIPNFTFKSPLPVSVGDQPAAVSGRHLPLRRRCFSVDCLPLVSGLTNQDELFKAAPPPRRRSNSIGSSVVAPSSKNNRLSLYDEGFLSMSKESSA